MAYPTKLLGDGEQIAFQMRPHWRSLLVPTIVLIATVGFGTYFVTKLDTSGAEGGVRIGVILVALVLIVGWSVRPFLKWLTTEYVFTNRRVIVRTGLVKRIGRDMPLARVNNVTFEKTLTERILNCGTLSVQSAAEQGSLTIASVPNVETIQREVYRLYEEDDERRRGGGGRAGGVLPSDGA